MLIYMRAIPVSPLLNENAHDSRESPTGIVTLSYYFEARRISNSEFGADTIETVGSGMLSV